MWQCRQRDCSLSSCLIEAWNCSSKIVAITKRDFQTLCLLHTLGWFFRGISLDNNKCLLHVTIISLAEWDPRNIGHRQAKKKPQKLWSKQPHFFNIRQLWARPYANFYEDTKKHKTWSLSLRCLKVIREIKIISHNNSFPLWNTYSIPQTMLTTLFHLGLLAVLGGK